MIVGLDAVGKHEREFMVLLESAGDGVGGWFCVSNLKTFVHTEQVVKQGGEKEGGDDHRKDDGQHDVCVWVCMGGVYERKDTLRVERRRMKWCVDEFGEVFTPGAGGGGDSREQEKSVGRDEKDVQKMINEGE